jgi:Domain of unknown function (DUF5659)
MKKEKDYIVFSQTMAGYMMMNGCKLKNIKPAKNEPSKFVYFFPNTEYVLKHAQEYINKRK